MNKELSVFLQSNFGIVHSSLEYTKEDYVKLLSDRIKFFIRTDMDKLMQALYKIDVSDKVTNESFDLGDIDKISQSLGEAIIERQLKKIVYRKKEDK